VCHQKDDEVRKVHGEDGKEVENAISPYNGKQWRIDIFSPEIVRFPGCQPR